MFWSIQVHFGPFVCFLGECFGNCSCVWGWMFRDTDYVKRGVWAFTCVFGPGGFQVYGVVLVYESIYELLDVLDGDLHEDIGE